MKLTNKYNYPAAIVRAVENDPYDRGASSFSATGLIAPARIRVLTEKHKHELEEDIDDKIFILMGHSMHAVLERAGRDLGHIVEKRYFADFDGVTISAQLDSLEIDDEYLTDWKNTSVGSFYDLYRKKRKPAKHEWVAQLNIQLEILRRNGLDAKNLRICGIIRDWRPSESNKDVNYPKKIHVEDIPMKPRADTTKYILSRIKSHQDAETNLPECNAEEHWSWRRCSMGYCPVSKFCTQYKTHKGELYGMERKPADETKKPTTESIF